MLQIFHIFNKCVLEGILFIYLFIHPTALKQHPIVSTVCMKVGQRFTLYRASSIGAH